MRFTLEHRFAAPVERVERAILEPGYQKMVEGLPHIGERRVTELQERPDGTIHRRVRYRLATTLPPAVVRVIGTNDVEWDEISLFDPARHTWRFRIEPSVFAAGFECAGVYRFLPDGDGTVRAVEVDVRVKVPLAGRPVERAIGDGLTETLEDEARLLQEYLRA